MTNKECLIPAAIARVALGLDTAGKIWKLVKDVCLRHTVCQGRGNCVWSCYFTSLGHGLNRLLGTFNP